MSPIFRKILELMVPSRCKKENLTAVAGDRQAKYSHGYAGANL